MAGFKRWSNAGHRIQACARSLVENLEGRLLLSNYSVSTANDSGPGSLRADIQMVNADASPDTITIGITGVISLTSGQLEIANDVTIIGPGAGSLTVSGDGLSRVFKIDAGKAATISGLTIAGGRAAAGTVGINGGPGQDGGGVYNLGTLTLRQDTISGNFAGAGGSGTSSNGGNGGGIYNAGILSVSDCTFSKNSAGAGGTGQNGGSLTSPGAPGAGGNGGSGGAIYTASGSVTIANSTFAANSAGAAGLRGQAPYTSSSSGSGGSGGALDAAGGTVVIVGSTLSANAAGNGVESIYYDRVGPGGNGGGIASAANLTLVNDTISGNRSGEGTYGSDNGTGAAGGNGGGIYTTGILHLANVTISNNTAAFGGGGYIHTFGLPPPPA